METVRVVLAEDNALLRQGVEKLIIHQDGLELLGTATDLPGLLALVEEVEPDVVVTDIRMPPTGTNEGIRAATHLREHRPNIGVVVLSQYANPEYALALLADGSARRAYLLKESIAGVDELARAIRTVAEGGSAVDPAVVDALIGGDGPGQEQCGHRGIAVPLRAGRGKAHQRHLLQAWPHRGRGHQSAGQGRAHLPGRPGPRLATPRGSTTFLSVGTPSWDN
jgi:DNA-binding NarL/FixJ family response regulator